MDTYRRQISASASVSASQILSRESSCELPGAIIYDFSPRFLLKFKHKYSSSFSLSETVLESIASLTEWKASSHFARRILAAIYEVRKPHTRLA